MNSSKRITLIQQNDIHGQLELHCELYWQNGVPAYRNSGGLARIATLAREMRRQAPDGCLFADCGDAIHGTAVAQWTKGAAIVAPLNAIGLDVMTPGNWEFGFGPAVLRQRVSELSFPVIASNIESAETGQLEFAPTGRFELGPVMVGVVGVSTPIVTERMPQDFGAGLRFSAGPDAVAAQVRKLREDGADLIVLLSHLGLAQDLGLLRAVEGIDVVLSGHTHDRLFSPIVVGKTLVIQSGFSGSFLGRLDLEIANRRVVDFSHALVEVSEPTLPDPAVQEIIEAALAPHRERLSAVVGETNAPLHRMTVLESPMDNLITDAYREWTGVDVAFSHGWRYGAPVPAGPVTEGHIWQMVPTNPELFTAEMTGEEIRQVLEDSLESVYTGDVLQQKGGYPIRFSGMSVIARLNNPKGARVAQLDIGGSTYSPERIYTVAAAGGQDIRNAASKKKQGVHSLDALREYFKRRDAAAPSVTGERLIAI